MYSPKDSASTTAIVICLKSLLAGTTFRRKVDLVSRPIASSKIPHYQNQAKCKTFLVKMSFICMRMKSHFHIKGWQLNLLLILKAGATRIWPIPSPKQPHGAIRHNYGPSLPYAPLQVCQLPDANRYNYKRRKHYQNYHVNHLLCETFRISCVLASVSPVLRYFCNT